MKIAVDAFGGDHAPLEIIKGCAAAVAEYGVTVVLVGDEQQIKQVISDNGIVSNGFEFRNATQVITMEDDPLSVIRAKKDSSMSVALRMVHDGEADAAVSAGNSGALLVGATMIVKRIRGVSRAAMAPVIPSDKGPVMLIDAGANVECTPEYLAQFGVMGSIYMNSMFQIDHPRVGLLNNGSEECKGDDLHKSAFTALQKAPVNFVGNVEGRGLALGECDVFVADGFSGNVALKTYEGVGKMMSNNLNALFRKNLLTKIGALMVMKGLKKLKTKMDYKEHGGAPLLGVKAPVIKAHGSSDARAFKNAIRQAVAFANSGATETIAQKLAEISE